ncbi:heme peroxidase [Gymnopus androsaceus JB14]|uniref:Peroxidase n=1 Tax=Gymnopus androsaceus JB14 TaxID=1447944 RepID=A0A6A4IB48_9AGAR|nr:heme peroxidase [Gymnopus androsaceus JB14]
MSQLLRLLAVSSTLAGYAQSLSTFQWPNPLLSYADNQLYEGNLDILVDGCPGRDNTTIAAQWLRIAYHDMSTHDVDDGTGGLDASIMYELDRPQNVGEGMAQSLRDFNAFGIITPFFGMADIIALGAVFAVPGPATVPEPQQDLATHIESFRQQGFNETEMIALVACGHTLGGVRQVDFPLIVTDTSIDVETFDTTPAFDNTIVSQYLQNITQDILVVGSNVTTQSDLRIFSSDGNATMRRCYVINDPLFSYQNGTFSMITALRVVGPSVATVTMLWADQQGGSFCPSTGCSVQSSDTQPVPFTVVGKAQGLTASRYLFNATINSTSSISKFWFEINNNNDGSDPIIVDNDGSGFVIEQDPTLSLFIDVMRSETVILETSDTFNEFQKVVVAVLGDVASTTASMTAFTPFSTAVSPPFTPTTTSISLELDETNPPEGGFTFFTANISSLVSSVSFVDITANVGNTSFTLENVNFGLATNFFPFIQISS